MGCGVLVFCRLGRPFFDSLALRLEVNTVFHSPYFPFFLPPGRFIKEIRWVAGKPPLLGAKP